MGASASEAARPGLPSVLLIAGRDAGNQDRKGPIGKSCSSTSTSSGKAMIPNEFRILPAKGDIKRRFGRGLAPENPNPAEPGRDAPSLRPEIELHWMGPRLFRSVSCFQSIEVIMEFHSYRPWLVGALLCVLLTAEAARSETVVGGGYHADQSWTKAGSPYLSRAT